MDKEKDTLKNESELTKPRLLWDVFIDLDMFLLESIKEHYRLITLSSFALLLATFSKNIIPAAFSYAVVSSILFMITFFLQIYKNLVGEEGDQTFSSTISGLSTLLALFLFGLVTYEYFKVTVIAHKAWNVILSFTMYFMVISLPFELIKNIRTSYKYFKSGSDSILKNFSYYHLLFSIYNIFWMIVFSISMIIETIKMMNVEYLINNSILNILHLQLDDNVAIFGLILIVFGVVIQMVFFSRSFKERPITYFNHMKEELTRASNES